MTYKLDVICTDKAATILKLRDELNITGLIQETDGELCVEVANFNNIKKLNSASKTVREMHWGVKKPSKGYSRSKVISINYELSNKDLEKNILKIFIYNLILYSNKNYF